jgi:hypothetical protein
MRLRPILFRIIPADRHHFRTYFDVLLGGVEASEIRLGSDELIGFGQISTASFIDSYETPIFSADSFSEGSMSWPINDMCSSIMLYLVLRIKRETGAAVK